MTTGLYCPPNCPVCKSENTALRNSSTYLTVVDCWDCAQTFLDDGTLLNADDEPLEARSAA